MKTKIVLLALLLCVTASNADVRIIVEDVDGRAAIKYQTDGEHVRAFALDIMVDVGAIVDINDFHRGESTIDAPGYGIFPSAFAAVIDVNEITGEVVSWDVNDYTPLADPCDAPDDTQPGLGNMGVTLELGALYAPPTDDSPNAPGLSGLLCTLGLSEKATVTVKANIIRGGIVLTDPTLTPTVDLTGAATQVDPTKTP